ncbi:MAG: thioredoxin family protein [Ignavibacteriales bacterium]|nr:thioredoxin family protein [Ignavibacteriales bacterium]
MKTVSLVVVCLFLSLGTATAEIRDTTQSQIQKFDPVRNPDHDLDSVKVLAKQSGKRILLDVGGEWCKWCQFLDSFFEQNADVARFLRRNYIVVKINFSKENKNEAFLSKYPAVAGYPHFFVLDSEGKLLHSQDTGALENGSKENPGHDHDKVLAFLKEWAPKWK